MVLIHISSATDGEEWSPNVVNQHESDALGRRGARSVARSSTAHASRARPLAHLSTTLYILIIQLLDAYSS